MPAKSESQRRLMAACAHGAKYSACPRGMSKSQMRDFSYKSKMPKGGHMSPSGNLGDARVKEADKVFPSFKNKGGKLSGAEAFGSAIKAPGHIGEKNANGGVTA